MRAPKGSTAGKLGLKLGGSMIVTVTLLLSACNTYEVDTNMTVIGSGGGNTTPDVSLGISALPSEMCDKAGAKRACYVGELEVANVGACTLGEQTCESSGEFFVWGPCTDYGIPSPEQCGDDFDSDCDGDPDNGCPMFGCDGVSPLWTDPQMDGSLTLTGDQTAAFGGGPSSHSWICSADDTHITVCEDTVLNLAGDKPTVIAGEGIGPNGADIVTLEIVTDSSEPIWIHPDTTHGPIQFDFLAPNAPITIVHSTPGIFGICGIPGDLNILHLPSNSVALGPLPGANCTNNRPGEGLHGTGGITISSLDSLPAPPPSCP